MNCSEVRENIWIREDDSLKNHLTDCQACSRFADEARKIQTGIDGFFHEATPGSDLDERIVRSLQKVSPAPRRVLRLGYLIAASAALLLAVFVIYLAQPDEPAPLTEFDPGHELQRLVERAKHLKPTDKEELEELETKFNAVLKETPGSPDARAGRAEVLLKLGRYAEAKADLRALQEAGHMEQVRELRLRNLSWTLMD